MWCYKILKPRRQGETDEHVAARLREGGAVAVEVDHGTELVAAYYTAGDVTDAVAALLLRDPMALPGATRLCWLDKHAGIDVEQGWIALHLADDLPALDRAQKAEKARAEALAAQRRERIFRS